MKEYLFFINTLIFTLMFFIFYLSTGYKNIIFFIPFKKDDTDAVKLVKEFRERLFKNTVCFYIISAFITTFFPHIIYITFSLLFYITTMLYDFLKCSKKAREFTFKESSLKAKESSALFLGSYDMILSLFITALTFYTVYSGKLQATLILPDSIYIIPVTSAFFNLFIFGWIKLLEYGADFNIKEVKLHLINFLCILSFIISYTLLIYLQFILNGYNIPFLINSMILSISGLFFEIVYLKFITRINKPFNFKIQNEKILSEKLIESNLSGTKLFLNTKSKKAPILILLIILYILFYLFLIFNFT